MNIMFFGTPDFAVPCLETLIKEGYNVNAVITQPDKKCGRGQKLTPPPVKETAIANNIDVYQPETLKDGAISGILEKYAPEMIVVVAYGKILPEYILSFPKYGCVNVHASLLPKLRGAAPIQWSIINGDTTTGVTTMLMDKGMDTGDILYKWTTAIEETDNSETLFNKLKVAGAELLKTTVAKLKDGKAVRIKQNEAEATYAPMILKKDAVIDWSYERKALANRIRGLNPSPGAVTTLKGKRIKIFSAVAGEELSDEKEYGKIWGWFEGKGLGVVAGGGILYITELQPENSKRMPVSEFLKGYRIEPGDMFGE